MDKSPNTPGTQRLALRPKQAALAIGIGQRKLWELTKSGKIPCVRVGVCVLYPVDLLQSWLKEQASKGGNS